MKNTDIINAEIIKLNLNPIETIVNTYPGWKRLGYVVKKGEKALFTTKIWRPIKSKTEDGAEPLILVKAAFFQDCQVEKA